VAEDVDELILGYEKVDKQAGSFLAASRLHTRTGIRLTERRFGRPATANVRHRAENYRVRDLHWLRQGRTAPRSEQHSPRLSPGEQLEATELLHAYLDVFSKSEYDLGRTLLTEHLPIIDIFTENMERQHIIQKSASFWANNVVVVNKHDGTSRIMLDNRALNNVTYKNCYPLPNIADCFDVFKGSSWFAILDLRSSF